MDGKVPEGGRVPLEYARQYWAWVDAELDADWGEPLGETPAADEPPTD